MEVAASIAGLLAAGAQLYSTMEWMISTCIDAPSVAHTTYNEVRDFRYVLVKLKRYVDGSEPITLLGASMIDVDHLSLLLSACVFTFSQLERKLDRLFVRPDDYPTPRKMDTLTRLKWLMGQGDIVQLVGHLQQHKSSLNILLTMLIWYIFVRHPLRPAASC